MIEQQGKVVNLEGNRASVQIGNVSGCAACDAGTGCGAGIFARLLRRKPDIVQVKNELNARPGQLVKVGIPENVFLILLLNAYLVPLLSGLVGAFLGNQLAGLVHADPETADGLALCCAVLSGGLALRLCGSRQRQLAGKPDFLMTGLSGGAHPERSENS